MAFKLVAAFFLVGIFGANTSLVKFENCDLEAPIQISSVSVKSPITIRPGERIPVRAQYSNRYDASRGTVFTLHSITVGKHLFWNTYVPIPVAKFLPKKSFRCTELEAVSPIPLCSGKLGNQQFEGSFTVPSSLNLPGIASSLGNGKYKVTADIRDQTGQRVVCIRNAIVHVKL